MADYCFHLDIPFLLGELYTLGFLTSLIILSQSPLLVPSLLPILLMLECPWAESVLGPLYYTYSFADLIQAQDFKCHYMSNSTHLSKWLLDISTWKSSSHLKVNMSKIELLIYHPALQSLLHL